jgi:hypothetical protein
MVNGYKHFGRHLNCRGFRYPLKMDHKQTAGAEAFYLLLLYLHKIESSHVNSSGS